MPTGTISVEAVLIGDLLQAKIAKVVLPFTLLAAYVVWMQSRSDRVVRALAASDISVEASQPSDISQVKMPAQFRQALISHV